MSYLSYWGLREKPFEELCDTRFFFESDDHREACDRMQYVVNDRNMNMGLLTGEIGSGKTLTKNVVQGLLPRDEFSVVGFDNSNFDFTDLLYDIVRRISFRDTHRVVNHGTDEPRRGDKYHCMRLFTTQLETLVYEEKRHCVLIFDEAQQIESRVLDEIKNLTNISSETENFLTVFFIGQPELREKVASLQQINQRIFLRFHLNNLDYGNTVKYIQHRLRVAGIDSRTIFTSPAYELVFRVTGGVPREINRLAKLALTYGYTQRCSEIGREDIEVIIDDFNQHSL